MEARAGTIHQADPVSTSAEPDTIALPSPPDHGGGPHPAVGAPQGSRKGSKLRQAEGELRASELLYRSVVDNLAKGVVVQDAAGRIIASNPAAREILGLTVDQVTGLTSFDAQWRAIWADGTPTDGNDHPATITRTTGRAVTDVVMGVRHSSGVTRWLQVSSRPLRDTADDTISGVVVSFRDITERRRSDQALRDAEALLNQTQALTKVGGWAYDVAANRVSWTDEVYRIHELPRDYDPNSAEQDIEFYAPVDRARIAEAFRLSVEEGQPYDLDLRLVTAKGREILVRSVGQPQVEDGRVVRVYGTITDITEQRRADDELRVSHALLRSIIQVTTDAVYAKDLEGRYLLLNHAAELITGMSAADMLNHDDTFLFPAAEAAVVMEGDRNVMKASSAVTYEETVTDAAGAKRTYLSTKGPLRDADGAVVGLFGIARDITERKQAEGQLGRAVEELATLNAELEDRVTQRTIALDAANRELEAFSYSVSHDLRAPLRAIDGFSTILLEEHADQLDSEGQRLLGIIVRNVGQMGVLIDDLLAFARVAHPELESRPVEMGRLARSVADELGVAEPGRRIEFDIDNLCAVPGDPALLRQVWANLLGNAAKFTLPAERPRIEVRCEQGSGECRYTVRDNGVGFDPAYAGNLFKPFQRLHTTSEFEGTGIGLAIVARIVQRHGGRVWAEGAPAAGATFGFSLPTRMEMP